jgi:EpsI family protein
LWFPIAYLLFMMPVWDLATEPMYRPLQMFAATLGTRMLTAIGVPVFQSGTFLSLPNITVEVAYACSGINFLMSVLAIGILLAYVTVEGTWRRGVLIAGSIVVALLANPVRVALILYSYYVGIASPRQSHMWQGMVVSLGAFAVLFAVAPWLNGKGRSAGQAAKADSSAVPGRPAGLWLPVLACACLLTAGMMRPLHQSAHPLAPLRLGSVPFELGDWRGATLPAGADSLLTTAASDELARRYRGPAGDTVELYVGRLAHRQEDGTGVTYLSDQFSDIQFLSIPLERGTALRAKGGVFRGRGRQAVVVYWYQLGGTASTNRTLAKLYEAWSAVTGGSGPVLVAVLIDSDAGGTDPVQTALRFSELVAPAVRRMGEF